MMTSGPTCCSASASARCLSSRFSKTASSTRAGARPSCGAAAASRRRGDAHARPGRRGRRLIDQAVVDHETKQRGDALGHGRASPFVHFHQPDGVAGQGEDQAGRQADQAGADDDDRAGLVGEWERRHAALCRGRHAVLLHQSLRIAMAACAAATMPRRQRGRRRRRDRRGQMMTRERLPRLRAGAVLLRLLLVTTTFVGPSRASAQPVPR